MNQSDEGTAWATLSLPNHQNFSEKANRGHNMVHGAVRGVGTWYKDGTERLEIWINRKFDPELPNINGLPVQICLIIGQNRYDGLIRSTVKNKYIWISPTIRTLDGKRTTLGHVLPEMEFRKNERVTLSVVGKDITLTPFSQN
jgi:hypothetical protein